MDPGLHPVSVIPGNGQKFQAVAEFPGELQVQGVKPADPLHRDGRQVQLGPVRQAHEDGQLVGRVDPFHVQGGIGFGEPLGLGLGQGLGIGGAASGHLGEDVIGGAVQDAEQLQDPVGGQPLAQGQDDGDAAAHRGLERDLHPLRPRPRREDRCRGGPGGPCWR